MVYTNKIPSAVAFATTVLFLAITIAPQWTAAQQTPPMPKVDPACRLEIPDIVQNCYSTLSALPSEECCKGLKSASKTQVTCLCDNFIAHPVYGNMSRPFYNQINVACGVLDKYACDGTSKGVRQRSWLTLNKAPVAAAVATAVLFLAVTIAPQWTEAKRTKTTQNAEPENAEPVCALVIPEIVQNCYLTTSLLPSEECCKDLKTASKTEVTCLCENVIANPSNGNLTRALYDQVNIACGVLDKFACNGANGGARNKIAASMGLFGLVASLLI